MKRWGSDAAGADASFKRMLEESTVMAVFSGHLHRYYGYQTFNDITFSSSRSKISVYYTGATTYEKFLTAEFLANKGGMRVTLQDSKTSTSSTVWNVSPATNVPTSTSFAETDVIESPDESASSASSSSPAEDIVARVVVSLFVLFAVAGAAFVVVRRIRSVVAHKQTSTECTEVAIDPEDDL